VTSSILMMQAPADHLVRFWSPTQKGWTRTGEKKNQTHTEKGSRRNERC